MRSHFPDITTAAALFEMKSIVCMFGYFYQTLQKKKKKNGALQNKKYDFLISHI